jgi:hypothetical protein
MSHSFRERQTHLIRTNIHWLRQAEALLGKIGDSDYVTSPEGFAPQTAGRHVRHILEFYECFLAGLPAAHIDYDARRRDLAIETSRCAAMARIREIVGGLEQEPALGVDSPLWVRMEDAGEVPEPFLISSMGRELQVLGSHAVHHFALIAILLRALGQAVEANFGVAPSTLRYWESRQREEAA